MLSGRCLCCAAHGLFCLITVGSRGQFRTLLFDTTGFLRAMSPGLGVDLGAVDVLVMSHGHWDHAGAMRRAVSQTAGASRPTCTHDVPIEGSQGPERYDAAG
jgi:7,8-dihydropterin-6-yl-methyl-4-(beta-D-ribofuranosyl)aminobenzene 5'-phosphate synthase